MYVELPETGVELAAGEGCAVVESTKAASDVYSPVDGEVAAINEALGDSPELVNHDPYGEGWLLRIRPSRVAGGLMDRRGLRGVPRIRRLRPDDSQGRPTLAHKSLQL